MILEIEKMNYKTPVAVWLYLLAGRGMFWVIETARNRDFCGSVFDWR